MDRNFHGSPGAGEPWPPFTDADMTALRTGQPLSQRHAPPAHSTFGRRDHLQMPHMSGSEPGPAGLDFDSFSSIGQPMANRAQPSNNAIVDALRMVMTGAVRPQELEHILPEDVLRQVRGDTLPPLGWQPHPQIHAVPPPPHPAEQPGGVDPLMFWPTPPPLLAPSPLHDSGRPHIPDMAFSRTLPPSVRHRTPSEVESPVAGPSTTRGRVRARSTSRRNSSAPRPSVVVPEEPFDAEGAEDDEDLDVEEDKRRRNTAASARFRAKKKQQVVSLERTISDLTSRADELEREASDLRRENGWLKEIVMLKGRTFRGQPGTDGLPREPPPGPGAGPGRA